MKKIRYYILIAIICISCDKVLDDPILNTPLVIPETIFARLPELDSQNPESKSGALCKYETESWDGIANIETRTYAVIDGNTINPETGEAGEYFQYWSEGDAISVFLTTENLKYQLYDFKDGEKDWGFFNLESEVKGGKDLSKTDLYYSVYPYKESTTITNRGKVTYIFPATQHHNGNSYTKDENGMIATIPKNEFTDDSELYFKNFCSYLELRLTPQEGKVVKKIVLVSNNSSDKIAGEGDIEIKNTVPVVDLAKSATNVITLDCSRGTELNNDSNRFWFVLPGGITFTEGFTVTIIYEDNTYFKKSRKIAMGIERNHITPMQTLTPTPEDISNATGVIRYKYEDPETNNDPYTLNNTFYGEDGLPLAIVDQQYINGEWVIFFSGTLKKIGGNSFKEPDLNLEYITVDNGPNPIIIDAFAFYNCTADIININNDVDNISKAAFSGSAIKNLTINGKVTTIGEDAFSGCKFIETVDIDEIDTIASRAFYMCTTLTSITIPGVKDIYISAFEGCTSLESISLSSIETIEDAAFMGCSSLREVSISSSCVMIGEGAFCNCTNLQNVYCYAVCPPFIKTDNDDSSYVFDNVHDEIVIYIPKGSEDYYLDGTYFENNPYDPNIVNGDFNWWEEEYEDILEEMEL